MFDIRATDWKIKRLLFYGVCEQCVTKYQSAKFKWEKYFVKEVETQLREKSLRGSQTQEFHYSEDKASNKVVTLTYPDATIVPCTRTRNPTWTLPNQVSYLKGSSIDFFNLGMLSKLDFTRTRTTHRASLSELANIQNFYLHTNSKL
jgi:hypothetical protein